MDDLKNRVLRLAEKYLDYPEDAVYAAIISAARVEYATHGLGYLLNNLKSIECKEPLLNVNIVFWHKRTACYLSYDDSIVAIPFEHPINPAAYASFKKNIADIFAILEGK